MVQPELPPRLVVRPDGWVDGAVHCPSPNCDPRPDGEGIDLLVLHNISLPAGCFGAGHVHALFCNRLEVAADPSFADLAGLRVSAHFLIERDGRITQFVACHERAWHAGVSSFRGRARCNDFSVGIELEGTDSVPFTTPQYAALAALTTALRAAWPLAAVRGHSDIAPGRKTDPGPCFDWRRYAALAALPPSFLG